MTVFTVIAIIQNYTLISKQSNKHILIVVKMFSISTNNIGSATEIGSADVKNRTPYRTVMRVILIA